MYFTKHNNFSRPAFRNTFFDDSLMRDLFNGGFGAELTRPAANIKESKEHFTIQLAVPGWNKEDFQIALENNQLNISAEKREQTDAEGEKFTRREFRQQSFKRSFELSDSIDARSISAEYTNGVLTLTLPKKQEAQVESVKRIEVK